MNYELRKDWFFLVLIILFALMGVKALFHSGFYTNHDGEHQVVRLWHFHKGLIDGQLPVRWAGTALNGFGYPLFNFTYRLPFWLGEIFLRLGLNLTDSIKAVFILSFIVSGITMYFFACDLWKSKIAGFLSAFLYLWAPYRFSNIFVRASLGEHLTFVFLPLVFWGILRLKEKQELKWVVFFAFGAVGLILSHALIFQLLLLPFFVFWLSLLFSCKRKLKFLIFSFLSALLTIGLSAYYFLPALKGKEAILGLYPLSFRDHFPTIRQLLYSPWGYGFSLPGEVDGMAFQVGLSHWLVVGLTFLFLLGKFLKKPKTFLRENLFALVFLVLFFLSIIMMLEISFSLWRQIFRIIYLDLPWRLLFISVFTSSLLAGFLIRNLKKNILIFGFVIFILSLNLYANRNHLRVNKYVFYPDSFYTENKGTTNSFNEYTPRWAVSSLPKIEKWEGERIVVEEEKASFKMEERKSNLMTFTLDNKESVDVNINILYHPGWQVTVDDQKKDINYQAEGLIRLEGIDPGKHEVMVVFKETLFNKVANLISLTSLLLAGLFLLKKN